MNKITAKHIAKEIKGLSVGKDRFEIMKRVAILLGKYPQVSGCAGVYGDILTNYLQLEECYNIAMAALEMENKRKKHT